MTSRPALKEWFRRFWQSFNDDPVRDYQRAKEILAKGLSARPVEPDRHPKRRLKLWKAED
jgi:hypothetical protein